MQFLENCIDFMMTKTLNVLDNLYESKIMLKLEIYKMLVATNTAIFDYHCYYLW